MTYPISFRRKVLSDLSEWMGKREAARLFKLSSNSIYLWLKATHLHPRNDAFRHRKIDKKRLQYHVQSHLYLYFLEGARASDVSISAISKAIRKLGFVKKNIATI